MRKKKETHSTWAYLLLTKINFRALSLWEALNFNEFLKTYAKTHMIKHVLVALRMHAYMHERMHTSRPCTLTCMHAYALIINFIWSPVGQTLLTLVLHMSLAIHWWFNLHGALQATLFVNATFAHVSTNSLMIEFIWNRPGHTLLTLLHMSLAIHWLLSLYRALWATLR
jgi:hypothetical protein